jgi:hypothetical protein
LAKAFKKSGFGQHANYAIKPNINKHAKRERKLQQTEHNTEEERKKKKYYKLNDINKSKGLNKQTLYISLV